MCELITSWRQKGVQHSAEIECLTEYNEGFKCEVETLYMKWAQRENPWGLKNSSSFWRQQVGVDRTNDKRKLPQLPWRTNCQESGGYYIYFTRASCRNSSACAPIMKIPSKSFTIASKTDMKSKWCINQDARESQRYKAHSQHLYEAAIKISKYTRHLEKMFKTKKPDVSSLMEKEMGVFRREVWE